MKQIETKKAVGHVICHDITIIIKDQIKDTAFRKGHVVREEDIEQLLAIGKDHLYVWEKEEGMLHENEAAALLASMCINENLRLTPVKEGKIEILTEVDGLFCVDVERLNEINCLDDIMIATRHNNTAVKAGDKLAGTRVVPLVIAKEKIGEALVIGQNLPLLEVLPYKRKTAGVITTGNEVYYERIKDTFTPVIVDKLADYGVAMCKNIRVPDKKEEIIKAIKALKDEGVDMIICTGGMSVDPDDMTPSAVKSCGAKVVSYGTPVLPGAMFLLAYFHDGTPIMGLPGCVMYAKATIFDIVLPRVIANITITKKELGGMGHGGLCLNCPVCQYPNCGFGKGL